MNGKDALAKRAATATFVGLLVLALFLLMAYAASFFFLVFGGILFAVVISAPSHWVSRKTGLSYGLSVGIVLLLLVLLIGGTTWLLAPTVSEQADQLAQSLPQSINRFKDTLQASAWGQRLLDGLPEQPTKLLSSGPGKGVLSQLTGVFRLRWAG